MTSANPTRYRTECDVILTLSVVNGKNPRLCFSLHQNKGIVISTEAAHSLIVSGAAEKSASLPPPSPATSAFAFWDRAGLQPIVQASHESGLLPAGGWSVAPSVVEGAKRLILLLLQLPLFFFCHFPPKNRMSIPKTIQPYENKGNRADMFPLSIRYTLNSGEN